ATPTAAAEQAVPVLDEVLALLDSHTERTRRAVRHRLSLADARLNRVESSEWFRDPLGTLERREQAIDDAESRLKLAWAHAVHRARRHLTELEARCLSAQPRFWSRQRETVDRAEHRLKLAWSQRLRVVERRLAAGEQRLRTHAPHREIAALRERLAQWERHLGRALASTLRHAA